jgi:hypothetical protein
VNELTDLEICKCVAEIEGLEHYISENKKYCMTRDKLSTYVIRHVEYNPLTDDALCFKLMVKYKVSLLQSKGVCCGRILGGYSTAFRFASPNRAICLAIIESKE